MDNFTNITKKITKSSFLSKSKGSENGDLPDKKSKNNKNNKNGSNSSSSSKKQQKVSNKPTAGIGEILFWVLNEWKGFN